MVKMRGGKSRYGANRLSTMEVEENEDIEDSNPRNSGQRSLRPRKKAIPWKEWADEGDFEESDSEMYAPPEPKKKAPTPTPTPPPAPAPARTPAVKEQQVKTKASMKQLPAGVDPDYDIASGSESSELV